VEDMEMLGSKRGWERFTRVKIRRSDRVSNIEFTAFCLCDEIMGGLNNGIRSIQDLTSWNFW